jgi:hypothetical protein
MRVLAGVNRFKAGGRRRRERKNNLSNPNNDESEVEDEDHQNAPKGEVIVAAAYIDGNIKRKEEKEEKDFSADLSNTRLVNQCPTSKTQTEGDEDYVEKGSNTIDEKISREERAENSLEKPILFSDMKNEANHSFEEKHKEENTLCVFDMPYFSEKKEVLDSPKKEITNNRENLPESDESASPFVSRKESEVRIVSPIIAETMTRISRIGSLNNDKLEYTVEEDDKN